VKKKIIFIINPRSGVSKKKNLPALIEKTIDTDKFDFKIIFTTHPGHGTELAKEAIQKGIDIIAVAGGDGSLNEVARVLLNSPVILAAIPMGSGNGLARHLKIPVNAVKAIKLINAGKTDKIDVGHINDKIFISNSGLGFVSSVVDTFHSAVRRGFFAYSNHTLKNFLGYKSNNYALQVDGQHIEGKFFMLNFANSNQFGYQAKIAPKADVKDGKLEVVMVKKFPFVLFPVLMLQLFTNSIKDGRYIKILRADKASVKFAGQQSVQIDGEPNVENNSIELSVSPLTLNIIVP
jgi:diacylglycerol kinase (ATP)